MHSSEQSNKRNQCDFASSKAGNLMRHLKMHSEKVTYASFRADPSRKYLKTHSGVKSNKWTNKMWLCLFSGSQFEETFENKSKTKVTHGKYNIYECGKITDQVME